MHTLSHNNGAHENLNWPDALQRHLALAGSLIQSKLVSKIILGDGIWVVNLVAKDDKWDLLKLLHGEKSIELGLGLGETLVILSIDEEDNAGDLWEVVLP